MLLNPVTYNWLSEDDASSTHSGFIAQDVQMIFPDLVTEDDQGKLSLSYAGFVPYLVEGLQNVIAEIKDMPKTLVSWFSDASNGITKFFAKEVHTNLLCVGDTCVTQDQFIQMVKNSGVQTAASVSSAGSGSSAGSSESTSTASSSTLDTLPPVITLSGPALINLKIRDSYTEEGAVATDNADRNISSKVVTSGLVDTSTAGTYTIAYDVSDTAGNKAAQVARTVIVNP